VEEASPESTAILFSFGLDSGQEEAKEAALERRLL